VREREPATYLAERIREVVAAEVGQLGLAVDVDDQRVLVRGRVDSDTIRGEVVAVVRRMAGELRVIDELERPVLEQAGDGPGIEQVEP
jgi:BON domain